MSDITHELNAWLDRIIRVDECVLSYDRSLLDQLPEILRENYEVRTTADIGKSRPLAQLTTLLGLGRKTDWKLGDLPSILRGAGVVDDRFMVLANSEVLKEREQVFEHWSEKHAKDDLAAVVTLQRDLAMGAYNKEMKRYDPERAPEMRVRDYLRSVTTPRPTLLERVSKKHFWEMRIKWWKLSGRLATLGPSLSVGPRWLTEIRYFRDIVGLRDHIGLDLFSDNPEMVVAGDMHAMPFSESHFRLVFLKNVVDKSYDIRTLVDELIRVTRDKGIVIVDQICGYHGCNPLGRTDIQSAGNLLRVFQARVHVDTLVKQDIDVTGLGDAAGSNARRNNARLALQLHKGPASR